MLDGPLDRRGQVSDDRVEPDVDFLVRVVLPAGQRHRNSPVEVACDGAPLEVARVLERVLPHVGAPVVVPLDPFLQLLPEGRQVEEEMLGLAELHWCVAAALMWLDQVDWVELVAAVVALVAARFRVTANGTNAFDIAVGQRAARGRVEGPHLLFFDEVALLVQGQEELLSGAVVIGRRRARENVVGHAETAKVLDDQRVVAVRELPRWNALLVCLIRDRGAVLVSAACHEHSRPAQPLETREDVGGHGESRHVADMARPVGVRPRRRNEDCSLFIRH